MKAQTKRFNSFRELAKALVIPTVLASPVSTSARERERRGFLPEMNTPKECKTFTGAVFHDVQNMPMTEDDLQKHLRRKVRIYSGYRWR